MCIRDRCTSAGISYGSCQEILTENLGMRRVAAKFVPRLLSVDQKQCRVDVCSELRETSENDPTFISRVTTSDERWFYGYDPETKQQSSQWKSPQSPRPKKARQVRSVTKTMFIVFFYIKGIVHREFVPAGVTAVSYTHLDVYKRQALRSYKKLC